MLRMFSSLVLLGALVAPIGCQTVYAPTLGILYSDVRYPTAVTSNEGSSKQATGQAVSFFGLFAIGDVSVESLARDAGITKIHHVDSRIENILGFGRLWVTVYGE